MKTADDWYQEGLKQLDLSRGADTISQYDGDLADALAAFDQAVAADATHSGALGQRGLTLARLDRHDAAVASLTEALTYAPLDAGLRLALAQSLQRTGKLQDALAAFDDVLSARPADPEALFGKADVLDALQWYGEALDAWNAVLGLKDNRALSIAGQPVHVTTTDFRRLRALLSRACALARLERTTEAVAAFREIFDAHVRSLHGPLQPVEFVAALRDLEPARAAYKQHLDKGWDQPLTWRFAGETWLKAGRLDDSLSAWNAMLKLAPDSGDAWYGKAGTLMAAERFAEAAEAYRKALDFKATAILAAKFGLERAEQELAARKPKGVWKVMGHDTFARHDYLVGEFPSEAAAKARLREKEAAAAATQDEAVRDEYWIVPPKP